MNWTDKLRENVNETKNSKNNKDNVRDAFNNTALKLIRQFTEDVDMGTIELTDIADVMRLYNMYLSVNDLKDGESGEGKLPELPRSQIDLFGGAVDTVKTTTEDGEEEEEHYINDDKFKEMSAEDVQKMLIEREEDVNKTNEGAF